MVTLAPIWATRQMILVWQYKLTKGSKTEHQLGPMCTGYGHYTSTEYVIAFIHEHRMRQPFVGNEKHKLVSN